MQPDASRFFPPSAQVFQETIARLLEDNAKILHMSADVMTQLESLSQAHSELCAFVQGQQAREHDEDVVRCQRLQKTLDSMETSLAGLATLQKAHQELCVKLDDVSRGISGLYQKDFPINVQFERKYYKDFPVCTSKDAPDFQKDFLRLIDGLDEESVEAVVLSLQRIKLIQTSTEPTMALYSAEERKVMRRLVEHFFSDIFKLSESCYFYRGYMMPIDHFEPCVFCDKCGVPFLECREQLADKDIIDAGAFIGDSALMFAPLTRRKVYAFEPAPGNFKLLLKTIEMNALTNVVPCNFALGEQEGTTSIFLNESASTQFEKTAFSYEGKSEVPLITLDRFVKDNDLHVGLIKADIEGAESLMLKGAEETLRKHRPALLISIYHNAHDYFKIKPWLDGLNLGYKFKIRHLTGGTVLTETVLIAEVS